MSKGFAVLGLGTIGTGVFQLWHENRQLIHQRGSSGLELVATADIRAPEHLDLGEVRHSDKASEVINADDVAIVVELIGGTGIAFELVKEALEAGKSVVTANKALIAKHGDELHRLADSRGVQLAYEASVCGGIPLLGALGQGLVANRIDSITGTVNGTCNYILSRMLLENLDFAEALETAQKLGFAEADPSFDIDGIDSAHKATILAGLAFGVPFRFDSCYIKGIRDIAPIDLHHCNALGYRLMHLAHCEASDSGVQMGVYPGLVPKDNILGQTFMEMNAALVVGNGTGPTFYYGAGAGARPTASAVIADVVDVWARLSQSGSQSSRSRWHDPARNGQDAGNAEFPQTPRRWYLRLTAASSSNLKEAMAMLDCGKIGIEERRLYSSETGEYIVDPDECSGGCDVIALTKAAPYAEALALQAEGPTQDLVLYPIVDLPE